jgi:hypothetical protein
VGEALTASAKAEGLTVVESRAKPEVQTASLGPTARSEIQPTESASGARPKTPSPESEKQLVAASGQDSTCNFDRLQIAIPAHLGAALSFQAGNGQAPTLPSFAKGGTCYEHDLCVDDGEYGVELARAESGKDRL